MSLVTDYLSKRGTRFERLPHDRAQSSAAEARALGLMGCEVAKTLMLDGKHGHTMAVVCADRRLDLGKVRELLDDPDIRLSTEDEIRRDFPNYELGALPALGSLLSVPMIIDQRVAARDSIVFADGIQTESVRVGTAELFAAEHVTVADIAIDEHRA